MPSHLSDIGFAAETEDELVVLHERAVELGVVLSAPDGTYHRWSVGGGVELWAQSDPQGSGIGLVPHFDGRARIDLGLASVVSREGDTALDGSLYAWAEPLDGGRNGLFPLVFDRPDHRLGQLELPSIARVQLAAFACEPLSLFASEGEYADPRPMRPTAIESFIPIGTFTERRAVSEQAEALAFFTGRILDAALLHNAHSGRSFHWMHVRTLGGEVDVVADPSLVPSVPARGGVVQGRFWLSGRIVETRLG